VEEQVVVDELLPGNDAEEVDEALASAPTTAAATWARPVSGWKMARLT
jgi:hypothetical protein